MASECCLSVTKYFLFLFNLIFFLLGLFLLGFGLWVMFSGTSILIPGHPSLSLFSYLLVISGSVTLLLGFLGSLGALKEVKCMLAIYFILLTIILAAQIIGTVLLFTQRSAFENSLDDHFTNVIKSFGTNTTNAKYYQDYLDLLQTRSHCCGWNGKSDWDEVPCSCHYMNETNNATDHSPTPCLCSLSSNSTCLVYKQNCKEVIKTWLDAHFMIILGVILALAVAEICGTILSMYLYNWVSMD